ncbi:MAG: XRE family transcriptional regulator [Pirellulaceae bacterium]
MALGNRLKFARESVGLTLKQIEARTGLGVSSISDWENEGREPSLSQLATLSKVYRRSTSFFLEEGEPQVDVVLWRQKPAEQAEDIERQLIQLAENYHRLETCCGDPRPASLNLVDVPQAPIDFSYAEMLAHDFRKKYDLGERPGNVLLRVLEEVCHVKVFHLPFEPTGTAACSQSERFGAAILLNSNNVPWRRNFDLAHELFHLLTWNVFRVGDNQHTPTEQEEKLANAFAGRLLMPPEALRLAVAAQRRGKQQLDFDDLFEIARQFDVSVQALLYQMAHASLIAKERLQPTLDALGPKIDFWDRPRGETPRTRPLRFEALAREAIEKGLISTGKFAEYMGLTRIQAMKIIASEIWTRPEQEADAQVEVIDS